MARDEMLTVFAYDISDDRRRARVAKLLEGSLSRVQMSVFEGRLGRAACEALTRAAERRLAPGDSLRVYVLGAAGERRSRAIGGAPLAEDASFWLL